MDGKAVTGSNRHAPTTSSDDDREWLLNSLRCLGCEKCEELLAALDQSDESLVQLTLWLEDQVIRLWTIEKRDELGQNYWTMIPLYLAELQCPACYYAKGWHKDPSLRIRVIFFLFSVATAEAYGDVIMSEEPLPVAESHRVAVELEAYSNRLNTISLISESELDKVQPQEFPLGFSTGDSQVDRLLILLRMNMLLDIEKVQNIANKRIAQLQAQTVPDAKPLKRHKQQRR